MRMNFVAVQLVKEKGVNYAAEGKNLTSPEEVAEVLREYYATADREQFVVMCLNSKNKLICINVVSVGSIMSSMAHPREIFKPAILSNAAAVIVAHNHPSGDTTPSGEDKSLTDNVVKAGVILGIPVLDHIIIGDNYYSFKEHSLI